MTAANNVFGKVREYDTDLDVFGNVFEWIAVQVADAPAFGWEIRTLERVWYPEERVVLFEVRPVERVWVPHEQR